MAYENPTDLNADPWYTQDGAGDYSGSDPNAMEFYDWLQQYLSNYGKTTVQPYPWLPPEEVGGLTYDTNNPWTQAHTDALTAYDNSTLGNQFSGPAPSGVVSGSQVQYGQDVPGRGFQQYPSFIQNPLPHMGETYGTLDPDSQAVVNYLNSPEASNTVDNSNVASAPSSSVPSYSSQAPSSVFSVSSVNYPSAFDTQDSGSGLQEDLMKQLLQNRQQSSSMKGASIL